MAETRKEAIARRKAERAALRAEMQGEAAVETAETTPSVATDTGDSLFERMKRRSADVDRVVQESVRGTTEDDDD